MIPEDFNGFQATGSADSNRRIGDVGDSRNNRRNDGSAAASFGREEGPSFSKNGQNHQQQSMEFIIPTEFDFVGARKNSGKQYYQRLIDRYAEPYNNYEKHNSSERKSIALTVADAFHYASESEMEARAATTRTPKKRRRFLKRVACIAKPGTVMTDSSKKYRYVENSDKEIDSRIRKSFMEKIKKTQKSNHSQKQNHTGTIVPCLKSPVKKKNPRDGTSSKLKQLSEQQRERQDQQQFFNRHSSNTTNQALEQQQSRQPNQQQQQHHFHYQHQHESRKLRIPQQRQKKEQESSQRFDDLLKTSVGSQELPMGQQKQQHFATESTNASAKVPKGAQQNSRVVATSKKTGFVEGDDYGAAPRPQSKPKSKTIRKAPKKVLPARKKKAVTKIRPPQRKQKNIATKKAPPPSDTPHVSETAQNNKSTSLNLFDATSTTTAKSDLDTAANALMGLRIALETPIEVYPVGTQTKKYFEEFQGWFQGTIRSYNKLTKFYSVEYEDGDKEDLEHHEIDTGSLPRPKYDRGTQYDVFLVSKNDGAKIGWFVGTIQSKYYHKPKKTRSRGKWRYNVVYNDGDSEDVAEGYITNSINLARNKVGWKNNELPGEKKGPPPVAPPKAAEQPFEPSCEQPIENENETENTQESSSESDGSFSEDDDDESFSEDEGDPNPNNIPYWTGKQHQQFIVGLRKYGLGNLEDIYEGDCIPSRSFRELIRYWRWYASDLEKKGLVLNYKTKGTVNGRNGTRFFLDYIVDEEEKEEDCYGGFRNGKWTEKEKELIARSCISHGHTYEAMSAFIKTRNPAQVKGYFNRHKMRVMRDKLKYIKEEGIDQTDDDIGADVAATASSSEKSSSAPGSEKRSWTPGEHVLLAEAFAMYGRNVKEMAAYMKSRSRTQISGYMKRNEKSITREAEAKEKLYKNIVKRTGAWNACELSMLVEGHAIFDTDFERIAHYVKTRNAGQVKYILEANASQYKDESAFDLGDHFAFSIELYHVLNVASFEGFDHIISWDDDGGGVLIHDNDQFANKIFPRYSHKGTSVQKFYNNLKLFGFQEFENKKKKAKGAFHHPAFQKGDSKKVERHCRKLFE